MAPFGLAGFAGEWVDSLGNAVSAHEAAGCVEATLVPTAGGDTMQLLIRQVGSTFQCGHYDLDEAGSSASRLLWRDRRWTDRTTVWERRPNAEGAAPPQLPEEPGGGSLPASASPAPPGRTAEDLAFAKLLDALDAVRAGSKSNAGGRCESPARSSADAAAGCGATTGNEAPAESHQRVVEDTLARLLREKDAGAKAPEPGPPMSSLPPPPPPPPPSAGTSSALSSAPPSASSRVAEGQVHVGKVQSYNREKGFGFIVSDTTWARYKRDVFLHERHAVGSQAGDYVSFVAELNNRGQPQARQVRRLTPEECRLMRPPAEPGAARDPNANDKVALGEPQDMPDWKRTVVSPKEKGLPRPGSSEVPLEQFIRTFGLDKLAAECLSKLEDDEISYVIHTLQHRLKYSPNPSAVVMIAIRSVAARVGRRYWGNRQAELQALLASEPAEPGAGGNASEKTEGEELKVFMGSPPEADGFEDLEEADPQAVTDPYAVVEILDDDEEDGGHGDGGTGEMSAEAPAAAEAPLEEALESEAKRRRLDSTAADEGGGYGEDAAGGASPVEDAPPGASPREAEEPEGEDDSIFFEDTGGCA